MEKFKLSHLKLVYPPLSSQEAIWAEKDPSIEQFLRQSDFYMIAGRREIIFDNFSNSGTDVSFTVSCGENLVDTATLHLAKLPLEGEHILTIHPHEKGVGVADGPDDDAEMLFHLTTEQLLYHRAHGDSIVSGVDRFREFLKYDLLYVGIAKEGDSFSRLIDNGHQARMRILSNEKQRGPGARVSDEIYLFLFRVEPLFVQTFEPEDDVELMEQLTGKQQKQIVADAEKAFVSLLNPQYNKVLFKSYPKGKDGLYDSGYTRYVYSIGETLTFSTPKGEVKGDWDAVRDFMSNGADAVFVEGDEVRLLVSGTDFPNTDSFPT
ncbi:hypothetical protein [Cupriavidus sp. SW-Y-13]|uniref:hypothetical protein n=1 Tax=Cupriavidus sp. SW-Y-13 TaxID=2653854 RepID=UPI00136649B8|nr:hypothetical protein [Cupriavidus sp. SW-Y-13]MWL91223.1 hypothetical protein [Cupriavidus sp. SW-Y-13]